jgi:hypothetical protein
MGLFAAGQEAPDNTSPAAATSGKAAGPLAAEKVTYKTVKTPAPYGTANYLPLWTGANTVANSVVYQSGSQVGVGTTAPTATLDVNGAINAAAGFNLGGNSFAFGSYTNQNAFLGFAGNTTMTGNENTGCGAGALNQNTTGSWNTAVGFDALMSNTTGYGNTASGQGALAANTTGYGNTANGGAALQWNTTGESNTATGQVALNSNTTGSSNTANGVGALAGNTTGYNNTAIGAVAMQFNTTGYYNTASGVAALNLNTVGDENTATGFQSLNGNTTGNDNTAIGKVALYSNTTGNNNTADGVAALFGNTTGGYNTATGVQALNYNATGSYNTALGYFAGPDQNSPNLTNATAIGAFAVVSQSNSLVLGGTGTYTVKVGIGTATPANVFTIAQGAGHALADGWNTYSSRRWKTNIQTLHGALEKVEQLRGVSYDLKATGQHEVGVIAEEVGAVVPEVVTWEKNGKDAQSVDYGRLTALLIEATKEQQALIHQQEQQIQAQQAQMNLQQAQIKQLTRQVREVQSALKASDRTNAVHTVKAETSVLHQ